MQPVLLPLAYWGTIEYWKILLSTSSVYIEVNEHLPKQTIRTFCQILNANGVQKLSIPVNNSKQKAIVKNVTIENTQRWQHQHWQSLVSSYKSAPYFEHYEPYIKPLYITPYLTLSDFNLATTYCILKILKQEKELMFTPHYENSFLSGIDLRNHLTFKTPLTYTSKPYYQVFNYKISFVPNLSILDLILNEGPKTLSYILPSV